MFSASEKSSTRPRRCRSSGMWPSPASRQSRQPSSVTSSAADQRSVPPSTLRRPAIASISSVWPLPSTPAMPTISPARTSNETSADLLERAVVVDRAALRPEQRLRRLAGALVDPQQHLAADHQARQALLGRPCRRQRLDLLAAAQHRDPVGDLEHLVQLVADEDDRLALLGQAAHDREQLLRLLRGQHRRRLVEDEDVRAAVERLQDLDPLLLADGDVLDRSRAGRRRARSWSRSPARASRPPRSRAGRRCAPARSRARCSRRPSSPGSA